MWQQLLASTYSLGDQAAIVGIATAVGGLGGVLLVGMSIDPFPDYGKAYAIGAAAGTVLGLLVAVFSR